VSDAEAEADATGHPAREAEETSATSPRREPVTVLETVRNWGLVLLLAWAPLPFGSARPWAWSVIGLASVMLLLLCAATAATSSRPARPLGGLLLPALLGVLLVAWIVAQSLPGGLFGLHHPLWDQAADYLGTQPIVSVSVDREASRIRLFRLLSYAGIGWVAWQVGGRRAGATLIIRAIALISTLYAAYGIVEFASANPSILWYPKWTYREDVTSTFVNRNSFATFAGLGVVANLVLFARAMMTEVDTSSRRTIAVSMIENFVSRGKWALIGFVVVGTALLLSHSRGGSSSTLCALIGFATATALAPSLRSRQQTIFGIVLAIGCAALFLTSGRGLVERWIDTSIEADGRNDIYSSMVHAIHDNLFLGTGLGTFKSIYPMYQGATFDGAMDFAHNDYLENALDLGLPGTIFLFAILAILVATCLLGVVKRRRDALFACAAVSASLLVGLHALVDFSMQIPAVAVTYMAILGTGVAQSTSSRPTR
jgi:O-antigen ligase